MKKVSLFCLLLLCAFVGPKHSPTKILATSTFLAQLNCTGPGCVNTSLIFPEPDAVSGAYPSPLTPDEQAGIYAPGNPVIRGYDESYAIVVGGNYTVPGNGGREVEGRVAVGGNLIINKEGYGMSQSGGGTFVVGAGGSTFPVAVQGTVSGSGSLGVGFNKGGAYIVRSGGANTLASSGAGSIGQTKSQNQGDAGVGITTMISDMKAFSSVMCGTKTTGTFAGSLFTGTNAGQEIFTVNNSSLSGGLGFRNIAPGATVIVNVQGSGAITVDWTALIGRAGEPGASEPDAQVYNVIFNFCEASSVLFNSSFIGAALIPNGNAEIRQSFDGRLYVSGNLVHAGESSEIHNYPFTGNLEPYNPVTLPVTLMSFQAKAESEQVVLKWVTQSEVDFSHFEIQHSVDARTWKKIGDQLAEGNSAKNKSYEFIHSNVTPGENYYRLKMIDLDGSFEFSRVQNAFVDGNAKLSVYPNPASAGFTLSGIYNPLKQPFLVKIYNTNGKLLGQYNRQADELDFSIAQNWPKGLLLVKVELTGGTSKSLKLFNQ